jgi:hypothetical protein
MAHEPFDDELRFIEHTDQWSLALEDISEDQVDLPARRSPGQHNNAPLECAILPDDTSSRL